MKTGVILIDNTGNGFEGAVAETRKAAEYEQLSGKNILQLELITEEMLSLVRSVTGEMKASFWIEAEDGQFDLHLNTKTVMDKEKRYQLISSASSRKNEAAKTFLGYLRNVLEEAMAAEADHSASDIPMDILHDIPGDPVEDAGWDGYERSVLARVADQVKVAIRGGVVDMTVSKKFAK